VDVLEAPLLYLYFIFPKTVNHIIHQNFLGDEEMTSHNRLYKFSNDELMNGAQRWMD
jgi:hypothetical protein